MSHEEPSERGSFGGNAVLTIVALGFLVAVLPLGHMTFEPLLRSIRATSWQASEAKLISSQVAMPHHRQYLLETQYEYSWDGNAYISDRTFFDDMVGVRKSYYYALNRELLIERERGEPLDIWVNPAAPEQAVIYRHIRWDKFAGNLLLFTIWSAITYVLVGALLSVFRK